MIWFAFIMSVIAIFVEYFQHRDFAEKHPHDEQCPSGVIGGVILSIIILIAAVKG